MQILLNGQAHTLADDTSVASLIERLELKGRLAVEIDGELVPRSEFPHRRLQSGERVEIVQAIGGG